MINITNLTQASKIKSTIRFIDKNYNELCNGLESLKTFVVHTVEFSKAYDSQGMVLLEMEKCFPENQEMVNAFFYRIERISVCALFEILEGKTYEEILDITQIKERYERLDFAWKTIANLNYLLYEIKRIHEKDTMQEKEKILEGMLVYI